MGGFGTISRKSKSTGSIVKYQYTWIITSFRSCYHSTGHGGQSPRFSTGENDKYSWVLDIFPNGYSDSSKDYVSIRIYSYSVAKCNDVKFTFEASILDDKGRKHSSKKLFISQETLNTADGAIKDFILRSLLLKKSDELLPDGDLKILCEIGFEDHVDQGVVSNIIDIQSSHETQTLNYLAKLFKDDKFSDFTLVVGDDKFYVHRAILSAHSRVFETMFQSNMSESRRGKAIIKDVDTDVMEKLLQFVYVGRVDGISDEMAQKLLIAANKYELETLKHMCEELLVKQLKIENVYEILLLADMHNASKIKSKAIEFLRTDSKKLAAEEEFDAKIRALPKDLQSDIICTFMANI